jgi:hypothetical protein
MQGGSGNRMCGESSAIDAPLIHEWKSSKNLDTFWGWRDQSIYLGRPS